MSRECTLLLFLVVVAVAAALPSPTPPSCACRDTVRPAVLYELYESLNGPYWRNNSGWSSFNYSDSNASDICTWYAVSCNEEDRTIAVFLYDNNASGVLPPGLGRLGPALVALWIQDTTEQAFLNPPVTGALPRGWGALTAITTLQLWGAFNGSLPLEWANMTSLVALSLGPGSLSGPIPDAWCAWTRLEQLALRNNALSGALPSCMPTSMPNLMALDVTSNFLTGPIPAGFANATSLVHFMVGSNQFTSEPFPAWFGLLPNIMTLDLSGTLYTGPLPAVWGAATTLQTINLANTFINDAIPNSWATLPSLRTMLADNASVTGRLPRRWVSSELSYFSFRTNSITGPLPEFDSPLPLQVNLAHNQFTGRVPLSYLNVTFEHLDLSHNSLQGTPDLCAITHHSQAAAMLMYNNFTGRVADLSCFGPKDPCSNQTLLTQYLEGNSFCGFCTLPPCP